jgi:hypothetical protein
MSKLEAQQLANLNKGFYFLKTVINGKVKTSSTW